MNNEKVHPICPECKGKNVELRVHEEHVWNALAGIWDDECDKDSYEYCNHCGQEISVEWVTLDQYIKAPMLEQF